MDLAADDLVPLVVLVILDSNVTQLKSTISFINEFDFSNLQERELGYFFGMVFNWQILLCYFSSGSHISRAKGKRME